MTFDDEINNEILDTIGRATNAGHEIAARIVDQDAVDQRQSVKQHTKQLGRTDIQPPVSPVLDDDVSVVQVDFGHIVDGIR